MKPARPALVMTGLLAVMTPIQAAAQAIAPDDPAGLASYCRDKPCRQNASVRVRLVDGNVLMEQLDLHRPAIASGEISVLLGESITAVPDFDGDVFRGWREPRRQERRATPVLTVKLSQGSDGSIVAELANAGSEPVKVRLFTRTAGSATVTYISSCPIAGNGRVYEYWSEPVVELIAREASLISDDAALMCD